MVTEARVVSVQVGVPREMGHEGAPEVFDRPWTSGIFKTPVDGPVFVGFEHLAGDQQADLTVHGGRDKAVCVYSADHYPAWAGTLWPEVGAFGAFGENLSVAGVTEDDVCIGDVWAAGDLRFQVSQPRQPCWKLARKWRIPDLVDRVVTTGRTGWYFRVLEEGAVVAGTTLTLVERPAPEWSITAANEVMHGRPRNNAAAAVLAAVPALSEAWRATLAKRV
jgi:MOSC domain-containing protein YiiM